MSGAASIRAFLVRCADAVEKVGFTLADGRDFLGWVTEVADEQVLVGWAPNPIHAQATGGEAWNPDDEWVPFEAIRPETLARYDMSARRWVYYYATLPGSRDSDHGDPG